MTELTDLEICKKIDEIECVEPIHDSYSITNYDLYIADDKTFMFYQNPLANKALLWDLMYKYDVSVCRYQAFVYIESEYTDRPHKASVSFSSKEEMGRAVLLAIIEALDNG